MSLVVCYEFGCLYQCIGLLGKTRLWNESPVMCLAVSLWRDQDDVPHCRILSRQNWMTAYLGYTLQMRILFCGWPIMVHDMHRRRRLAQAISSVKRKSVIVPLHRLPLNTNITLNGCQWENYGTTCSRWNL